MKQKKTSVPNAKRRAGPGPVRLAVADAALIAGRWGEEEEENLS